MLSNNGVLQGALSANATISHLPLETCVVPNVDHGTTFTWSWISEKYHEIFVGCVGFVKKIWLLDQPRSNHGRNLPMKIQWVELHKWGSMDGT